MLSGNAINYAVTMVREKTKWISVRQSPLEFQWTIATLLEPARQQQIRARIYLSTKKLVGSP